MRKIINTAALALALFAYDASAQAESDADKKKAPQPGSKVYVSDDVSIWTRAGAGPDFRIVGSVMIGDQVTFLQAAPSGKYYQIQKEKNSSKVWIEASKITTEPAGKAHVKILEDKIKELEERFLNYDTELARELKDATAKLEKLQKENQGMAAAIEQKDQTINELDELRRDFMDKLETKELDMQMRWWVQGAAIAVFGAIVGVILIFIPRPDNKKKKNRF